MKNEISKLMKKNDLVLIREKKHMIWKHIESGEIITTSKTPSSSNVLFAIKRDIRRLHRRHELVKT